MKCKICGNVANNKMYILSERILNKGDKFSYFLCNRCETLQLADKIKNVEKYYCNYRVFKSKYNYRKNCAQKILEQLIAQLYLILPLKEEQMRKFGGGKFLYLWSLRNTHVKKRDYILDVGCGSGNWLGQLAHAGYKNLYGVDKYADEVIAQGWNFRKGDISSAEKIEYDFITFHHSFEHMDNPYSILQMVKSLLKSTGICIIRIPLFGKAAWRRYGIDWYQIDAPRHLFIYSEKAIKYMCKKVGLEVFKITYDSDYGQIYYSEGYKNTNLSLYELADKPISSSKLRRMQNKALELNKLKEGDQAIFYIKRG